MSTQQIPQAPQASGEFHALERERIRQALKRYMEERRIGTPALQDRIIAADKPRHREIPLSTLQRFLAGSHHTSDLYVDVCHNFAKDLSYFGEGRDLSQFGAVLSAFLCEPVNPAIGYSPAAPAPAGLAGEFQGISDQQRAKAGRLPGRESKQPVSSELTLAVIADRPFLEATEQVYDLIGGHDRRYTYEGVLVLAGGQPYAVLRSTLTRLPRIYSFAPLPESAEGRSVTTLHGQGFESDALRAQSQRSVAHSFSVEFKAHKPQSRLN